MNCVLELKAHLPLAAVLSEKPLEQAKEGSGKTYPHGLHFGQ
jgi:hypothetical protein